MSQTSVIIPAAGNGTRMQASCPKQYLNLADRPILVHTVGIFHAHQHIDRIIVAVPQNMVEETKVLLQEFQLMEKTEVIAGGLRRQDSVQKGLLTLSHQHIADDSTILVHDGARPLVSASLITACIEAIEIHQAAIAAVPVKDTIKRADAHQHIAATVDRTALWQAQTPQGAQFNILQQAFKAAESIDVTDEAMALERIGIKVYLVNGSAKNIKITRPEDLCIAENILQSIQFQHTEVFMEHFNPQHSPLLKIGHGYDAHRFAMGKKLVLAGIKIAHDMGLDGHSDADVVTHALCDAILGALGMGDVGRHFPDTSQEFKDIYSIKLLEHVIELMEKEGYTLNNADITIILQKPKLTPYMEKMCQCLAETCNADIKQINIKATTTEKMGFTGREEGIACHAMVTILNKTYL